MRIGVVGVAGRMGRLVAEELVSAGASLAGGTSRSARAPVSGLTMFHSPDDLAACSDVIVDFTHADTVVDHARAVAASEVGWVLGTTGLSAEDEAAVAAAARTSCVVRAANFSPGANLLLALARQLGAALPADVYDAEIVEMHHRQKVDAPSGTAWAVGQAVAAGRDVALAEVAVRARDGQVGARRPGEIGFAALRGGQIVGEHTLIFTAADEQISLNHRAFDRRSFARGAVRAALWTAGRPPGLYSMQDVLRAP